MSLKATISSVQDYTSSFLPAHAPPSSVCLFLLDHYIHHMAYILHGQRRTLLEFNLMANLKTVNLSFILLLMPLLVMLQLRTMKEVLLKLPIWMQKLHLHLCKTSYITRLNKMRACPHVSLHAKFQVPYLLFRPNDWNQYS